MLNRTNCAIPVFFCFSKAITFLSFLDIQAEESALITHPSTPLPLSSPPAPALRGKDSIKWSVNGATMVSGQRRQEKAVELCCPRVCKCIYLYQGCQLSGLSSSALPWSKMIAVAITAKEKKIRASSSSLCCRRSLIAWNNGAGVFFLCTRPCLDTHKT